MSDALTFAIAVLAAYWLARTVTLEEGPFSIFLKVRTFLGAEKQESWLGRGVSCPKCAMFYAAFVVVLLTLSSFDWRDVVLIWFAVAGAGTALYLWLET